METNDDFNRIVEMNTEAERRHIAAMAMQGLLGNPAITEYRYIDVETINARIISTSLMFTDALIAELNKKKE